MDFIKKDDPPDEQRQPTGIQIPLSLLASPLQGEKAVGKDGRVIGVICGWGWMINNDKSATMRPVVLLIVRGGVVIALPAEIVNTVPIEIEPQSPIIKPGA